MLNKIMIGVGCVVLTAPASLAQSYSLFQDVSGKLAQSPVKVTCRINQRIEPCWRMDIVTGTNDNEGMAIYAPGDQKPEFEKDDPLNCVVNLENPQPLAVYCERNKH